MAEFESVCNIKQEQKRWIIVSTYCKILPNDIIKLCNKYCADFQVFGWNLDAVDRGMIIKEDSNILICDDHSSTFRNAFGDWIMYQGNIYQIKFKINQCNAIHFGVCSYHFIHKYIHKNINWHSEHVYHFKYKSEIASIRLDFIEQLQNRYQFMTIIVDLKKEYKVSFVYDGASTVKTQQLKRHSTKYVLSVMMYGGPNQIELYK